MEYFIEYRVEEYRVKLSGGENHARGHYQAKLSENEELEAWLIWELARNDTALKIDIEERAAIDWEAGGCVNYDEIQAVKDNMRSARMSEVYREYEG